MSQNAESMLLIGQIVGPFGVRGELKATLLSSHPEAIARQKTLYVGPDFAPRAVVRFHEHKPGLYIMRFKEVVTREDADAMRGLELYIHEAQAAPLEEDEYFLHDLYGMAVRTSAGDELGTIADVLETGANDVLVVRKIGRADLLVPMIREVIQQLDVPSRTITITSLEAIQPE